MIAATKQSKRSDAFRSSFAAVKRSDGAVPPWLSQLRSDAFHRFTELGFPTTRHEEWRFTNIAPIARADFVRLTDTPVEEKGSALATAVNDASCKDASGAVFVVDPEAFGQIPGSPFAYWTSEEVFSFSQNVLRQRVILQQFDWG